MLDLILFNTKFTYPNPNLTKEKLSKSNLTFSIFKPM